MSYTLPMSNDFLYITYTKQFPLSGLDSQVIWITPPTYSLGNQGTTVLLQHVTKTGKEERGIAQYTKLVSVKTHRPLGLQEVEDPRISRQSAHEGGKVVSPTHQQPLPSQEIAWYSFLLEAETTPGP